MQIITEHIAESDFSPKKISSIILYFIFCGFGTILFFVYNGFSIKSIVFLLFVSSIVFMLLNFKLSLIVLIALLFLEVNYITFSIAEVFVLFLIFSLIITYKNIDGRKNNNIIIPFLIFILTISPSYLNSIDIIKNLMLSLHLVVFFLLIFFIPLITQSYKEIQFFLKIFLAFTLINGVYIIFLAITLGKRVFGFAGVMYVDYVGIALVITFIILLYKKKKRIMVLPLFIIFMVALIFTQTRNAWISTGVTLILILIQFIFIGSKHGYSRLKVLFISIFLAITLIFTIITINNLNPKTFNRVQQVETKKNLAENMNSISSFATRFFIWKTAWNAFSSHPVIGIGFYSFPIASHKYSSLDPLLYKQFVKSLTPHMTFIALACETGILGLIGFIYFLTIISKKAWGNYKKSATIQQKFYSLLIFWTVIYILISMTMTDAWLWGDGLVLWGILLGFSVANGDIIDSTKFQLV